MVLQIIGDSGAAPNILEVEMCKSCGMPRTSQDALDAALRMVLSVPLADLLAFRKLAKAYFALMEVRPAFCYHATLARCCSPALHVANSVH